MRSTSVERVVFSILDCGGYARVLSFSGRGLHSQEDHQFVLASQGGTSRSVVERRHDGIGYAMRHTCQSLKLPHNCIETF